jgi:hypothetical protein
MGTGVFFFWSKTVDACSLHGVHGENLTVAFTGKMHPQYSLHYFTANLSFTGCILLLQTRLWVLFCDIVIVFDILQ